MQIPSGGCILESHPPFPQWTEGMTHACENITLPQTSFAGINESKHRVHMPSGSQDSLKLKAHAKQSKANFFLNICKKKHVFYINKYSQIIFPVSKIFRVTAKISAFPCLEKVKTEFPIFPVVVTLLQFLFFRHILPRTLLSTNPRQKKNLRKWLLAHLSLKNLSHRC